MPTRWTLIDCSDEEETVTLTLTSPAFADGERIPVKYARDGENLSPPLKWTGTPDGTQSFALIVQDPDAPGGMYYHAEIVDIPRDRTELPQSIDTAPDARSLKFGTNSFGNARYDGPEPPHGHGVHHYHFRLLALDVPKLDVPAEASIDLVLKESAKHTIEEAELVGTYER